MRSVVLISACVAASLSGCSLLAPEDPPLEPKMLYSDDFAWDNMEIAEKHSFIGVPRIDCPTLQTVLSDSGKCIPKSRPYGNVVECPVQFPAKTLEFGCLDTDAVWLKMDFDEAVRAINFLEPYGPCQYVEDGPLAGKPERYPTDPGYKACLFTHFPIKGTLKGQPGELRPSGFFIDLANNPIRGEQLTFAAQQYIDYPLTLIVDARLMDETERAEVMSHITGVFKYYRTFTSTVVGYRP